MVPGLILSEMKTCGECDGILVVFPLDSTTKHAFCDDKDCNKQLGDSGTAWHKKMMQQMGLLQC